MALPNSRYTILGSEAMASRPIFISLFLAPLLLGVAALAKAQVCLVSQGEPRAVVVTADGPTKTAAYAAEELVRHLQRATGVGLDVVEESELPPGVSTRVFIGETKAAAENEIDVTRLGREAYVVRSVGNDLFIVGREDDGDPLSRHNSHVGTLWGVYDFLENELGVRWLWPGPLGTHVPRTETIQLASIDRTGEPPLLFRELAWSRTRRFLDGSAKLDTRDARLGFDREVLQEYAEALRVFLRRHRMGGMDAKPPTGHRFHGWWRRYGREHPEWFALRKDGTRGHPDPDALGVPMCVTNEELQDFIVEQWDGESAIMLGPVDGPGRCMCDRCRAWDGPQPKAPPWFARMVYQTDPRAKDLFPGATSDRYARFWKVIQQKAAGRNPDVLISGSFIYENEFPAPTTDVKLGPNFYAEFVQWQDPHLRWFPMPDEAFDWIKQQWLGWRRTGIRMGYRPNYLHDGYVMPHFETRQSGRFFKFAYKHGMEGARFDSLTGQWATHGLRLYVHLRLMADPEMTVEEIRAEYFSAFGSAADEVEAYWDYWEDYANENMMRFLKLFREVGFRYRAYPRCAHEAFPPACFEPARAKLAGAMKAARQSSSPEYADRVRFLQIGLEHACLTVRLAAAFDGQRRAPDQRQTEARQALADLVRFRKTHQQTFFSDLLWVTSFWERPRWDLDTLDFEEEKSENVR
jgi:hypothetical protein